MNQMFMMNQKPTSIIIFEGVMLSGSYWDGNSSVFGFDGFGGDIVNDNITPPSYNGVTITFLQQLKNDPMLHLRIDPAISNINKITFNGIEFFPTYEAISTRYIMNLGNAYLENRIGQSIPFKLET